MNLVDLFGILPGYIELAFGDAAGGLAILRVLRMARILRMVKLGSFEMYLGLVGESRGPWILYRYESAMANAPALVPEPSAPL